jgi:hypothetical protein
MDDLVSIPATARLTATTLSRRLPPSSGSQQQQLSAQSRPSLFDLTS